MGTNRGSVRRSGVEGWFRRLFPAVFLIFPVSGCTNEFTTCAQTKTCPPDPTPDASRADGGLHSGATGGRGGEGGKGGQGIGVGGAAAIGTGGQIASGGRNPDPADAAKFDGSLVDGGPPDAQVTPPCSSVDGGISSDPDHCGSCSVECSAVGATSRACVSGACKPVCAASRGDCNLNGQDGCEVDLKTDAKHCSACGTSCSAAGTTSQTCVVGVCTPTCDATHADCNKNGVDGCEVDFKSDPDHCGSCSVVCAAAGTSARQCVNGLCKPTCDATHADCNKNGADGCEIDVKGNADNCGACGYACSASQASQRRCIAGACSPLCVSGSGDCHRPAPAADDGCETALSATTSCGSCGHDCLGGQCTGLVCQEVVLGSGLAEPASVAVADSYAYWIDGGGSDNGRVMQTPLRGGGATPVASGQMAPGDIVNDGLYVYWSVERGGSGAIRRGNIGGPPSIWDLATPALFSTVQSPGPMALDATYLYWADLGSRRFYRMPKDGSASPLELAHSTSDYYPSSVAVDSTNLYYATEDQWALVPNDGSAALQTFNIPAGSGTSALALDGTSLFFRSYDSVTMKPCISKIPRGVVATAQAKLVAAVNPNDNALAVDATYIYYWSDALYRVAKTGGTPTFLSGNVDHVVKIVIHPEQGEEAIYWVNNGQFQGATGSVRKLALPP